MKNGFLGKIFQGSFFQYFSKISHQRFCGMHGINVDIKNCKKSFGIITTTEAAASNSLKKKLRATILFSVIAEKIDVISLFKIKICVKSGSISM